MLPILAQTQPADGASMWIVVIALTQLLTLGALAFNFVRAASGRGSERQIEPTAIAGIQSELKTQTSSLGDINREIGEVKTLASSTDAGLRNLAEKQSAQTGKLHTRIDEISRELGEHDARITGLEKREQHGR